MKNMIVLLLLLSFTAHSQEGIRVHSYTISVEIFPQTQSLTARAHIELSADPQSMDSLVFYLHKEFSITEIKSDVNITYNFKTEDRSPYFWMPDARPLRIHWENSEQKNGEIEIVYQGPLKELKWHTTNMITESWIELGNYCAWFPYHPEYGKFISDVKLSIDPSYKVTGMGSIQKIGQYWHIRQIHPTDDIVVIASKDLKTYYVDDKAQSIRLDCVTYDEQKAHETVEDVKTIVQRYNRWFTTSREVKFTIVIVPPFSGRGSYHRENFMALLQPEPGANISYSLLAHEIAHEWWSGAPTNNFEDWLNESFAEYASLMAIRDKFGGDRFEEWILYKEFRSRGVPPILQADTDSRRQASTLYDKGPLALYRLENRIGRDLFLKFLSDLLRQNITSTDALLDLLEETVSEDIRVYFENELRK